jgi:glycosyltransferase involved in cell wall biosynthesis
MKVGVYAIAKNESANVERFLAQTRLFDSVTVLDTGSTDDTVEKLRAAGVTVFQYTFPEFDFARARNHAASITPSDTDWLVSLDFNEVLHITAEDIAKIKSCPYSALTIECLDSEHTSYSEPKLKIHRRSGWVWNHAVHEALIKATEDSQHSASGIKLTKHRSNSDSKWEFYQEICEREFNNTGDPHYLWWMIRYYEKDSNLELLEWACREYLKITQPYSISFRIDAWLHLANIAQGDTAIDLCFIALGEAIHFKNIDVNLGVKVIKRLHDLGIEIHARSQV